MKLSDKINNQTIILPLNSICKNEVMHELLDHFYKMNYLTSTVKLFSYLDNQDKEFNSAPGRGVAFHYHTSIEIRYGRMTREKGIELARKYDNEFPSKDFNEVLSFLDLKEDEFEEIVNKHRNEEIWKTGLSNKWELINSI